MAHPLILNRARHIELSQQDRRQHMLISGLPSTGVSTYLMDLIRQDIKNGIPVVLFDPYGDIATNILESVSETQLADTAYIDVGNNEYPIGLNLFEAKNDEERREIVNTVVDLLYALYDPQHTGIIGPRFEHAVRNAILTIFYDKTSTFIEVVRCLTDASYVDRLLPQVTDPFVKSYWTKQIAQTSDFHKSEVLDYIVSKFSKFVSDKKVRNIVGQANSTIDFVRLLQEKKLIVFDLSKIRDDFEATRILYEIILLKLMNAVRKRTKKETLSLYIDEVHDYPSLRLKELLRTGRRDDINLIVTTQRVSDIDISLRKELLKVGTLISFRVSTDNALILAPEFHTRTITVDQLCMLKRFHMSIKMLHEGNPMVFEEISTEGMSVSAIPKKTTMPNIKADFVRQYGKEVEKVEHDITSRMI